MKFARFWARATAVTRGLDGSEQKISTRSWSNESQEQAEQSAQRRASELASKLQHANARLDRYDYGIHPLPEAILEEFSSSDPEAPFAVITRNAYGAEILNSARMMFVDVDSVQEKRGFFANLFSKQEDTGLEQQALKPLRQYCEKDRSLSFRVYRTAAGFRLILTSHELPPHGEDAKRMMAALQADPLYMKLCKNQESYRARLTPKPWRCGLEKPTPSYPFRSQAEENKFQEWLQIYQQKSAEYATCAFLGTVGSERVLPAFEALIGLHDAKSGVGSLRPLA